MGRAYISSLLDITKILKKEYYQDGLLDLILNNSYLINIFKIYFTIISRKLSLIKAQYPTAIIFPNIKNKCVPSKKISS